MASAVDVMMDADSVSAARRRRERRLRQFLCHERLSVAMALSEKKHHTSRGQRKDRAGGWGPDVLHGQVPGAPTPPQEKVQQCTVEQLADVVPMVQILDTPGLLGRDQVVEAVLAVQALGRRAAAALAEQIVDNPVPQVRPGRRSSRSTSRTGFNSGGRGSGPLTFQFLRVGEGEVEVFKVLSQFWIQQRLWNRSLTIQLAVEAFKVFAQVRVSAHPS